jgi:dTMP kinase
MSDVAELMLFSASRAQLVAEVIRPALAQGEIVICDRFYDSTTAYQGYGRGLNLEAIRRLNSIAADGTDPDLTIVVDVAIEEIERRRRIAGVNSDRMEMAGREFYERVREGYRELIRLEPERIVRVDGMAAIEDVQAEVWQVVQQQTVVHRHSV